jgi:Peroxiredoxin
MQGLKKPLFTQTLTNSFKRFMTVGQKVPNLNLTLIEYRNGQYMKTYASTTSLFSAGKSVLFGFTGAYNPACENFILPEFIKKAKELKKEGVKFYAMSVNDPYVLQAFAKKLGAREYLDFIADGSAELTKALNVEADLSEYGFGLRCRRFAITFQDGKIVERSDIEEDRKVITPFNVSPGVDIQRSLNAILQL